MRVNVQVRVYHIVGDPFFFGTFVTWLGALKRTLWVRVEPVAETILGSGPVRFCVNVTICVGVKGFDFATGFLNLGLSFVADGLFEDFVIFFEHDKRLI